MKVFNNTILLQLHKSCSDNQIFEYFLPHYIKIQNTHTSKVLWQRNFILKYNHERLF